jgi:hypothetical protein
MDLKNKRKFLSLIVLSFLLLSFSINFFSKSNEVVLSYNMNNLERGRISEIIQDPGTGLKYKGNTTLMIF